jgi:hypothetical protein
MLLLVSGAGTTATPARRSCPKRTIPPWKLGPNERPCQKNFPSDGLSRQVPGRHDPRYLHVLLFCLQHTANLHRKKSIVSAALADKQGFANGYPLVEGVVSIQWGNTGRRRVPYGKLAAHLVHNTTTMQYVPYSTAMQGDVSRADRQTCGK